MLNKLHHDSEVTSMLLNSLYKMVDSALVKVVNKARSHEDAKLLKMQSDLAELKKNKRLQ